jgi:hypothetical protein
MNAMVLNALLRRLTSVCVFFGMSSLPVFADGDIYHLTYEGRAAGALGNRNRQTGGRNS